MGWSCRVEAGQAMDRMQNACIASTGQSNTWKVNGKSYFFETSSREHADGAITGTIQVMLPQTADGKTYCRKAGTFRIEGNGTVTRAPAFLKSAASNPAYNTRPAVGTVGIGSSGSR